jgi:hypothetical protein
MENGQDEELPAQKRSNNRRESAGRVECGTSIETSRTVVRSCKHLQSQLPSLSLAPACLRWDMGISYRLSPSTLHLTER